jgi:hypothetical protein
MRLASAAVVALAVAVLDVLGACRPTPAAGRAAPSDAATAGPADAQDAVIPARCRKTDVAFALDDGHGLADLEVGDAIAYPGGYAVGLVHRATAGRVAAVALFRRDPIGLVRVLDLGPTMGDAPPPHIGWREGELVAAAYARPLDSRAGSPEAGAPALGGDATRDVALYTVAPDAAAAATLSVPQRRDDSFALDLAFDGTTGLLVWDEATSVPRGVVKASVFTRDHASAARDVSPADSDAELPRVVARGGGGFAVVWIARRPDPGSGLDGSPNEATGEARAYGWLETITVDPQGQPSGPVRRLTPVTGHVSAYDIAPLEPPQGAAPSFLLVARDDGEAVDGSGGTLVRVRVTGEMADPPVVVVTEGLGRGAPSFVSRLDTKGAAPVPGSAALALMWVGKDEQGRLLPIDVVTGAPTGSPSAEDAFDDARALLFMGAGPSAASSDVLAATPSDSAAQLRVFACTR